MENKEKKRGRLGLSHRITFNIVLLTALIGAASCIVGYIKFNDTIRRMYNENGYMVGDIILSQIDTEEIAGYTKSWQEDAYYPRLVSFLQSVQEASGSAYIYIVVPNTDQTMTYVYDSSGLSIGDMDPISSQFDDVWYIYETGEYIDDYFVRHSSKYGYLTSSILPVKTSDGKVCALLFVDTWMQDIESTLLNYILTTVLISAALLVLFCIGFWYFMRRRVIKPLEIIGNDVREFIDNDAKVSGSLTSINTNDELQELSSSIYQMENDTVSYIDNIKTITAERERIGAELSVAADLQADMLPNKFPAFPEKKEFDIYATMTPAKEVGGDFYDFFLIDDDHLAMVMADVSGKGMPAALFMVTARTLIKNRAMMGDTYSPARILSDVNRELCEDNKAALFVTVALGIIELSTGKGVEANCGHEYPIARRGGGEYEIIKYEHSPALGIMEDIEISDFNFMMAPGDSVFIYTDGVTEAKDPDGERYGMERMVTALNQKAYSSMEELLNAVKDSLADFVKDTDPFDDITMMAVEYKGKAE